MGKTACQHQEFARSIAAGFKVKPALIHAGYSPAQARKGWAIVRRSRGLRDALAEQGRLLVHLGHSITAEEQEALVRGRFVLNVIQGTDKGVASARALGNDRRVSMWQPDVQQGTIVLNVPARLQDPEVWRRMLEPTLDED